MCEYCIIKINHNEKYIAVISGGSRSECESNLAYINGLNKGYEQCGQKSPNEFKIIPQKEFDQMYEFEAVEGIEMYQQMFA